MWQEYELQNVRQRFLNTLSSYNKNEPPKREKSIDAETIWKDYRAYTLKDYKGENYIILEKNEKKIVIEKAPSDVENNISKALSFSKPQFSSSAKYLTYQASGWEWSLGKVYDVENNKELLGLGSMQMYGFADKENYFYACSRNDFSGENYVNIYSVPDFELIDNHEDLDLFEGLPNYFHCEYNGLGNTLLIVADSFHQEEDKTLIYKYDFENLEFNQL